MNLQRKILNDLSKRDIIISNEYAKEIKEDNQSIIGAIKSLESLGDVINVELVQSKSWCLTEEGENVCKNSSLEAELFYAIPQEGSTVKQLKDQFEKCDIALGQCFKFKWARKDENGLIKPTKTSIEDITKIDLLKIKEGKPVDKAMCEIYKKRKLITLVPSTIFKIKKGSNFATSVTKQSIELTKDMIESGAWKNVTFKPFNIAAKGKLEHRSGYFHPLMQLRDEFRKVFMQMGFKEMATNNYVESAFWNFDALFQPQKHPARDAQDTFYVSDPERTIEVPKDYLEKVKKVHSVGDFGSTGYRSPWSINEAYKNLLRTHTTAVSARLLQEAGKNEEFKPFKYYSIDKVYRNETLDATHLAEFFQVEGVMGDYNLSIKRLMGTFSAFYKKIGIHNIRFKPAYNPYTEPSMEIFGFHPGLKKWIEIGNSGMFRPEMLRPMGLPENATVFGWGLSLERPAMIMYGINNIRELVGSKCKLELLFDNAICTIDKFGRKQKSVCPFSPLENRQKSILEKLNELNTQISSLVNSSSEMNSSQDMNVPSEATIFANPLNAPNSLAFLMMLLRSKMLATCTLHKHSSVKESPNSDIWNKLERISSCDGKYNFRIVWHSKYSSCCLVTSNSKKIFGEVNICRYVCRLLEIDNGLAIYEKFSEADVCAIDYFLDSFQVCTESNSKKDIKPLLNSMETSIGKNKYLCGEKLSIADIVGISWLMSNNMLNNERLSSWIELCKQNDFVNELLS